MRAGVCLAGLLMTGVPSALLAQASPPVGTTPPAGMGPSYDMRPHDADAATVDQVDSARRNRNGRDGASRGSGKAVAATSADLQQGAAIYDKDGESLGSVESVDQTSVVVAAQAGRVAVPAEAFGKNRRGLMLQMSKADFEKLVAGTAASH